MTEHPNNPDQPNEDVEIQLSQEQTVPPTEAIEAVATEASAAEATEVHAAEEVVADEAVAAEAPADDEAPVADEATAPAVDGSTGTTDEPADEAVAPAAEVAANGTDSATGEESDAPAAEPTETAAAETVGAETAAAEPTETAAHERAGVPDPAGTESGDAPAVESEAPAEQAAAVTGSDDAPAEAPAAEPSDAPNAEESAATEPASQEAATPAVEQTEPAVAQTETAGKAETAAPAPKPVPRPGPRPGPVPTPAVLAHTTPAVVPPVAAPAPVDASTEAGPPLDPIEVAAAAEYGRVDADGTVHVREGDGERVVGQYPGVSEEEALSLYIRRFLDLQAQVRLFGTRLSTLTVKDLDSTLAGLTSQFEDPAVVGDLDGLRAELEDLREQAAERRKEIAAEREAARAQALAERTVIVERAEEIAGADPARVQWRQQGEELRKLLDEWKHAQKTGVRLDRPSEDALWKRFSHARSQFDRNRRQYFAELDKTHGQVKATKEQLIERAEALSGSTDWGPTAAAYRDLMDEWKRAGRASRKEDDALWARFRAAQDTFFEARNARNAETDAEFGENLKVKLTILTEAEGILPVRDLRSAKAKLRDIQDRWEAAGKVPRGDLQRVEARLRAVEEAIRDAEQREWKTSNPRVRARAEGAAAQLEAAIAGLEEDLEKAKATGDARRIKDATEALDARKAWLEQVLRAADDAR
ncbi:DUF349 domain-containing protein [Occultella aeris]|uniref:DUF349 domain-containing protein n=1 Tax=Occultella aeris TaxID=2761496 RepID=A0A7M4DSU6_9MICO|nr:DUF349 domain-containing protein [Occultella aeris]VZO40540.1 hypothetical protein HALOF300_05248 [Occultella aeris]